MTFQKGHPPYTTKGTAVVDAPVVPGMEDYGEEEVISSAAPTEEAMSPTQIQEFLAMYASTAKPASEDITVHRSDGAAISALARHRNLQMTTVYDPAGYPRKIPAANLRQLLDNGFKPWCPLCKGRHGGEYQDCPKRPEAQYMECPWCRNANDPNWRRRFYDETPESVAQSGADPNRLESTILQLERPEKRIETKLFAHMAVYHRLQSIAGGVPVDNYLYK